MVIEQHGSSITMPATIEQPRFVPYSPSWHGAKIVLRIVSLIFAVVLAGLAIASKIRRSKDWCGGDLFGSQYCPLAGAWKASLPPGIVILVYDLGEIFTFCVRYNVRRGAHPAISVACDLVICLMCLPCAFFTLGLGLMGSVLGSEFGDFYNILYREDVVATVFIILLL